MILAIFACFFFCLFACLYNLLPYINLFVMFKSRERISIMQVNCLLGGWIKVLI